MDMSLTWYHPIRNLGGKCTVIIWAEKQKKGLFSDSPVLIQ